MELWLVNTEDNWYIEDLILYIFEFEKLNFILIFVLEVKLKGIFIWFDTKYNSLV